MQESRRQSVAKAVEQFIRAIHQANAPADLARPFRVTQTQTKGHWLDGPATLPTPSAKEGGRLRSHRDEHSEQVHGSFAVLDGLCRQLQREASDATAVAIGAACVGLGKWARHGLSIFGAATGAKINQEPWVITAQRLEAWKAEGRQTVPVCPHFARSIALTPERMSAFQWGAPQSKIGFSILQDLAGPKASVLQPDLETIASRRSLPVELKRLETAGLVARPNCKRSGYVLTDRGRNAIR